LGIQHYRNVVPCGKESGGKYRRPDNNNRRVLKSETNRLAAVLAQKSK